MAFLDHVVLNIKAGKGGDGVVRWRTARAEDMGGPAGGDGGNGGNVYVVGQRNMHTLHLYAQAKDFSAEDGFPGGAKNMHGAKGKDLYMYFPLGTELYIAEYDKMIELLEEGQTELLFTGGAGGLGNTHFKSSTNRSPEEFTVGKKGEFGTVTVNLKMIADVGLIGYPNAGKSSLLNTITKAQSKVGNYNFTTLEPHLGDWYGYIIADIPGLIEGASDGKGLGIKFLKHVERTGLLVHLIDSKEKDYAKAYKTIRTELGKFNPELLNKKEIVMISKIDNLGIDLKVLEGKSTKSSRTASRPPLKGGTNAFKILTAAKIKKLSKDEKLLYKLELAEFKKNKKDLETRKKLEALVIKTFKKNKSALEKFVKKPVRTLSLYDDKSVKDFEITLKKALK